jgi:hypothetical protein
MIDPQNIVRYDYTDEELEELIIFAVCVAGKKASTIAPRVHSLCHCSGRNTPFSRLRILARYHKPFGGLPELLKNFGIGCFNQKAETIQQILDGGLDLRTCSVSDLEAIKGIGPKTARFFIMSSRKGVQHAALDTHILRWMRDKGVNAPKSTPTGKKYLTLEQQYLTMVPAEKTPAEFDLEIWKKYSSMLLTKPISMV